MIAMNPAVRRAEEVIAQAEKQNAERMIMEDIASLSELDSSIKTFADVPAEVIQKAMSTGMNLVDAYFAHRMTRGIILAISSTTSSLHLFHPPKTLTYVN